jgi:uncharacterized protein YkwD
MRRNWRVGVAVTVLAGGLFASIGAAVPATAKSYVPGDESRVRSLVNGTRGGKGLRTLALHDALTSMARAQSDRMADRGDIYHNPSLSSDINSRGVDWQRVGENVGMGPNVDVIEQAFLDSPAHYDNIVHPSYDSIGVGVTKGDDGKVYVTQVFADFTVDPGTAPPPASAAPAAAPAAPAPASAAPVAGAAATPPAAPPTPAEPTPAPASPTPNALTGGYVNDEPLPDTPAPAEAADQGALGRLLDAIAFWS